MTSLVQDQADHTATAQQLVHFAAEEFERIAALSQVLMELMNPPRFYSSPALVAAQLATIDEAAEAASATVSQLGAAAGIERDDERMDALLLAQRRFLESRQT